MIELDIDPNAKEVLSAVGALVICLSEALPEQISRRAAKNLRGVVEQMLAHGHTNVGTIAATFVSALETPYAERDAEH